MLAIPTPSILGLQTVLNRRFGSAYLMDKLQRLYSLDEVAQLFNLSPHTVRALVRKGKLHPVPICRRLLFDPAEIAALMKA